MRISCETLVDVEMVRSVWNLSYEVLKGLFGFVVRRPGADRHGSLDPFAARGVAGAAASSTQPVAQHP